jgi:3-oxoacyl-[acyl-carrier-protein] synthase II
MEIKFVLPNLQLLFDMKNEKIFISGLGSISALGYGTQTTWANLLNGKSGLSVKSDWNNNKIKPHFYGEIPPVQFDDEVKWMNRFPPSKYSQLGILACKKAIIDSGLVLKDLDNENGLIIETSLAATEAVESYLYDLFLFGITKISPIKFTKTVANKVLGDISLLFKINGPSSLLYNENSICYGVDLIKKGIADIIICGGVDHYTEYRVLSEQESDLLVPMNAHFDESTHSEQIRKNILGDGACFIVLESETSVKRRQAKVYAELLDYSSSFDYKNVESTTIRSKHLLDLAFNKMSSDIPPKSNFAFMSAYSTPVQAEFNERSFIDSLNRSHQVSTVMHKAFTGDMKAASSVMGVSIACQMLQNQKIPHLSAPATSEDLDFALINTVHEGGGNSYFLLKTFNN